MKDFSWQTPEYSYKEKSSDWYWIVGIISAALVITTIIFGDALFGIVIAIGAFTLSVFAARKPKNLQVHVTDKGVAINKTLYLFSDLNGFYLDEEHWDGPRLMLRSKKILVPLISVPVKFSNTSELRSFISEHIKEQRFDQGFLQTIFERLGF